MVLLKSKSLPMGSDAMDFSLTGVDGLTYTLDSFNESKVLVIVFMCNHCPYVQAIWGRLNILQESFDDNSVSFVGINPNTSNESYEDESFEKMKEYYDKYDMNFPYLEDMGQEIAQLYEAQCTPDIYVYDSNRKLAYHGRLDDNWQDENDVSSEDLSEAIKSILDEKDVKFEQIPAMGCSIKWV